MSYMKETFLKLEMLEKEFYDLKIAGYPVWRELKRIIGYRAYSRYNNSASKNYKFRISNLKYIYKDIILLPKNQTIIFESNRKLNDGYTVKDTVSSAFEKLNTFTVDDLTFKGKYSSNRKSSHYYTISRVFYCKFWKMDYSAQEMEDLVYFNKKVNNVFGYEIISKKFLLCEMKNLIVRIKYYKRVFKKIAPKEIICATGYINTAVCIAARSENIKVSEIQYSMISKYHIAYSFFKKYDSLYFPDNLYLWSNYWNKEYLYNANILYYDNRIKYIKAFKKSKEILYVSQDFCTNEIEKIIIDTLNIKALSGYKLILKPHPWETTKFMDDRVKVLGSDTDLIDALKSCEIVITVFSTAYYEALHLGCNVLLLRHELNDMLDEAHESHIIDSADEILLKRNILNNKLY